MQTWKAIISCPSSWFTYVVDKQVSTFLTITQTLTLVTLLCDLGTWWLVRLNLSLHIPLRSPIYSQHSVTITPFSWVCFESAQDVNEKFLNVHWNIQWKTKIMRLTWNSLYKGCKAWHKWWWRGLTQCQSEERKNNLISRWSDPPQQEPSLFIQFL